MMRIFSPSLIIKPLDKHNKKIELRAAQKEYLDELMYNYPGLDEFSLCIKLFEFSYRLKIKLTYDKVNRFLNKLKAAKRKHAALQFMMKMILLKMNLMEYYHIKYYIQRIY